MTNTHPKNIARKRKANEPKRRHRRPRIIPPPDMVWFDKPHAAGYLGLSESYIDKHRDEIGGCDFGERWIAHCNQLDAWALSKSRKRDDKAEGASP
jgi:hypothetical protein